MIRLFEQIGRFVEQTMITVGHFVIYLRRVFSQLFKPPFRFSQFFEHLEKIGVDSTLVVVLSTTTTGMILALQLGYIMRMFHAEMFVGSAVAMALSRELAPIMTAIVLIARNGSSMAAEIGSMRVTEQLDAMEIMAVDPIHYLVVPRVWAAFFIFPVLTAVANIVGIAGAYFVSTTVFQVDASLFFQKIYLFLDPNDVYSGLMKSAILGVIVALISTYNGYITKGGAKGVGRATTTAVVTSTVAVLVADYIMTDILLNTLMRAG
ncbi:ABC transporter permease [bacterium]|nr:ABC transporter permease [bacterium]